MTQKEQASQSRDPFRWIPWMLVPAVFLIYAFHPTRKFYFDGVVFASFIEHGPFEKLFNPHHLLYTGLFSLIHSVGENIAGRPVQALYVMQWGNIFLGSIGALLMWRVLTKLIPDRGLALLATLLSCFSFTYWHYATDADVYILSTLFLLLAADRLLSVVQNGKPKYSDFVYIGLMQAGSVLFHQLNVFWVSCMIGCFLFNVISGPKNTRWRWWWAYAFSLATPVAVAYLGIGILVLKHTSLDSFLYWITEYGHEPSYWTPLRDIPYKTLNGYMMVFFHGPSVDTSILEYDLARAMDEGRFFKGFIKKVFGYYSLGFLFFCYMAAIYNIKKYTIQFRNLAILSLSWMFPYVIFQLFFMPMNYFYKLFIFPPLLAMLAWFGLVELGKEKKLLKYCFYSLFVIYTVYSQPVLGVLLLIFIVVFEIFQSRTPGLYRWGLFIVIAFLPLYNYMAGILPESKLENNPEVLTALAVQDDFRDGDILIFTGGYDYPNGWIISALTPARAMKGEDFCRMSESERNQKLWETSQTGARIFIHPNITEGGDFVMNSREKEAGINQEDILSCLQQYEWREGFEEMGRKYWELIPPNP